MQLTVPQRTVANAGSFPVNPDGVAQWLKNLHPLDSEADAREIYRGLKHSNRLHNDVDQRRAVISCFIPVLQELHDQIAEMSQAQPLPLSREFTRSARLGDLLLREEAFAFKILLLDNPTPLADDARHAMQALARQAESLVHAYRPIPDSLVQDAHQLYALAEEQKLLLVRQSTGLLSLLDHYRFILLACIADLSQQRVRQLALVVDFLKSCAPDVHIEKYRLQNSFTSADYAINLALGSRPEPARSLLSRNPDQIRWFNITPVLYRIDSYSSRIRVSASGTLGSDTLERQSLARLHVALSRTRKRRSSRQLVTSSRQVIFGHKEVCAHLFYQSTETPTIDQFDWSVVSYSTQGICLQHDACPPGLAQAGELVNVTEPNTAPLYERTSPNGKIDALLGVVRWVCALDDQGLRIGIEFLARSVLPVHVLRDEMDTQSPLVRSSGNAPDWLDEDVGVGENALIVACKVQKNILQTMLLPSHLYHSGDKLIATQNERTRHLQLRKCLQTNGLFSQFSLADTEQPH